MLMRHSVRMLTAYTQSHTHTQSHIQRHTDTNTHVCGACELRKGDVTMFVGERAPGMLTDLFGMSYSSIHANSVPSLG